MTRTRSTYLTLVAVLLSPIAANADLIIYDNGVPNTVNGRNMTNFIPADDFSFGSTTEVDGAEIFLTSRIITEEQWNTSMLYDDYTYFIYDDAGGTPGSILQTGLAQNAAVTTSALSSVLANTLLMTFDFISTFSATGGQTYWLGLTTGDVDTDTFWAQTDSVTGNLARQRFPDLIWRDPNTDYAYRLTAAQSVPEPGTLALFGIGLLGMGLARYKRKT